MKKIYVSGPISNMPDENRDAFTAAQLYLECKGHQVVNPFALDHNHGKAWADFMRVDLKALLECDEVFMLSGWEFSRGARMEHGVAYDLAMPIRYQDGVK